MKLTYFGHSTFSVEVAGKNILFDPFITSNPSARDIDVNSLRPDFILVTHAHGDHVGDAVTVARRTGAKCVSNFEICNWLNAQGVTSTQPLNHGGSCSLEFGRVKYVNAIHSSSFPDGTYGGNPGGFVVETTDGSFYVSGDTALTTDMKLIGERFDLAFAVLCIGEVFTMGVEDAAQAAQMVGARKVVGVHYDTFPPIKIDHSRAKKTFDDAGVELLLVGVGETIDPI